MILYFDKEKESNKNKFVLDKLKKQIENDLEDDKSIKLGNPILSNVTFYNTLLYVQTLIQDYEKEFENK